MTDKIPHADLIRAALDGATIQNFHYEKWNDRTGAIAIAFLAQWCEEDGDVRLKPKSIVRWVPIVRMAGGSHVVLGGRVTKGAASSRANYDGAYCRTSEWQHHDALVKILCLELDPDTLDVISATTEAP